jgi:murein DD-endopeptidase MepM/ murein hydrolase activator NlpD
VIRTVSISRIAGALTLLLVLRCAGAPGAAAAEPSPPGPSLRIVPAVRYGVMLTEQEEGILAPRARPLLAWYQGEAPPGGLAVAYTPESRESFPIMLLDERGRVVSRGTSFRWGTGWLSLIGIPATARPGAYELQLPLIGVPFRVTARTFASETIPLTETLTALRTQPDPRKTAEAAELLHLLETADPAAVHETGPFAVPLAKPRRTAGYGDRREYRYANGRADFSVHNGVDLALPEGTPVSACGSGRVVMAKERVVTGWTVAIEHLPGLYSLYCHMSGVAVEVGELVEKGQRIGSLGMTGLATGPHLHWEVLAGGVAVDPDRLTTGLPFVAGKWPIPEVQPSAAPTPAAPTPVPQPLAD